MKHASTHNRGKTHDFRKSADDRLSKALEFLRAEAPEANISDEGWPHVTDTPHHVLLVEGSAHPKNRLKGLARGLSGIVRNVKRTEVYEGGAAEFYVLA